MFLIDDLLLVPFTGPLNGLVYLAEKINEVVDKELNDGGVLKEKLMELQMKFEMDEIDEEEFTRKEEEILERLRNIK
ncbi:MAG: gas vesicle protein GvpG [Ignavibacteriota bacterium]|nr:gas vesicle protein GvpG [Ignavibacteriota bacterium]